MNSEYLDKIFIKEFRDMMRIIRGEQPFSIDYLPIPILEEDIDTGIKLYIDNIDDQYFSALNKQYVTKLEQSVVRQNVYWNSGEIKEQVDFRAGADRVIIRTEINLGLPFRYESNSDKNLEYIDFKVVNFNGIQRAFYFYAIPTIYCYSVSNTALVVSEKSKPKHYGGIRLVTTWGYYVYLYIVNVKGLKDIESQKIIKTGIDPQELRQLMYDTSAYWVENGLVFDYADLNVCVPIDNRGNTNLAYSEYEPTMEYEERTDLTLAEEQLTAKDLFEASNQ